MIPEFTSKIAFRLKIEEREVIDELIATGKYKNISAFVREAIEEKLMNFYHEAIDEKIRER